MERVQKIIAHAGICSRRDAEDLIKEGKVQVNGETIEIGAQADPEKDTVRVMGEEIKPEKKAYYALHKPPGVITTVNDPHGRPHVLELIHDDKRLFPVGRLDQDTSGLIIITNDGDFANKVMHPRYEVEKEYEAVLDKPIRQEDIKRMSAGVILDDRKRVAKVRKISSKRVSITVTSGVHKEVKRLFKSVGYWVRELKRTRIGPVKLDVREGKFRKLTQQEIRELGGSAE